GIELVLLYAAYAVAPFAQPSVSAYLDDVERLRGRGLTVGVAPHSVRACPPNWLEEIGGYAEREGLVLHVHACEQPKEVEDCVAAYGVRPIELLARSGCLGPRTTVVHATHASDAELDLLRDAGSRVCVCPTTEANLGDGFAPIDRIHAHGIGVCIGSDSNVRIDPLEELRELDGIARRLTLRRDVVPLERLLAFGSDEGAAALGLERWGTVTVDTGHPSLRGVDEADVLAALLDGCSAEVLALET
ncbi:MAG TPA: amidohydrolase family protein, partial [Gaiellaceae bacterium]|nr:amidohydrolase family protein [Gaiellaceae bacterium]